jgi:hypothetical protein
MRHWSREGPPTYIAAAAYLGLRRERRSYDETVTGEDLLNILSLFPGGERTSGSS